MDLSDCLRMPVRVPPRVVDPRAAGEGPAAGDPQSPEYFCALIDGANRAVLSELERRLPAPAWLLAFVRGGYVRDRLEIARERWPRIVQIFGLAPVLDELSGEHGEAAVREVVSGIRSRIIRGLVANARDPGPNKLLLRFRKPDLSRLSRADLAALESFVAAVATLSRRCDAETLAVLRETDLGEAHGSVRERLAALLVRFDRRELAAGAGAWFDGVVETQRRAGCLHPALPLLDGALAEMAAALDIGKTPAREIATLLRVAWLSRISRPKHLSDLALKALVVVGQEGTSRPDARLRAEGSLARVREGLEAAAGAQPDLRAFARHYPDVRIGTTASVLSLPDPLFRLFVGLGNAQAQLQFLIRQRMGPGFQLPFLAGLGPDAALGAGELADGIVSLRAKGGACEEVMAFDASPETVREALAQAARDPAPQRLDTCKSMLTRVERESLVESVRGFFAMKS